MFKVCNIFVDVASFHFEGEDVSSHQIFAHMILERFGEVIDDCGPDPFVHISAPKRHVLGD